MYKALKDKETLRSNITQKKKQYTQEQLGYLSQEVLMTLEITGAFVDARKIFIYHSLPDEVQTTGFIEKWCDRKEFYLPVVVNDDLVFRKYLPSTTFNASKLGVKEPDGLDFTDYDKVDLVIVPGMAFDRKKNRMGRGKGYYDRFLPRLKAPKMGICFDFQLYDSIPFDADDVKMDLIVSENDLIW